MDTRLAAWHRDEHRQSAPPPRSVHVARVDTPIGDRCASRRPPPGSRSSSCRTRTAAASPAGCAAGRPARASSRASRRTRRAAKQLLEYLAGKRREFELRARPARHRVPARGLARAVRDPVRRDDLVRGAGAARRPPERAARGRRRERREPDRDRRAVPPRRERGRQARRLRRRAPAQEAPARARARAAAPGRSARDAIGDARSSLRDRRSRSLVAIPIAIVVTIVRRVQQIRVGVSDPRASSSVFAEPAAAALRRAGADPEAVAKLEVLGQEHAADRARRSARQGVRGAHRDCSARAACALPSRRAARGRARLTSRSHSRAAAASRCRSASSRPRASGAAPRAAARARRHGSARQPRPGRLVPALRAARDRRAARRRSRSRTGSRRRCAGAAAYYFLR